MEKLTETLKEEKKESKSIELWEMKKEMWKGSLRVDLSDLHLL